MRREVQPRLMKVFEIQENYQKHRQRLMSIQLINTKKKQHITTIRPSHAEISFKQSKFKADLFNYKSKNDRIQHDNMILLNKIEKQYTKSPDRKAQPQSRNSSRSLNSSHSSRSINLENKRIYQKINSVKSNYSKFRNKNKSHSKIDNREELLHLLVNQLGVKPSVLFPKVDKKIVSSINSPRKSLSSHQEKSVKRHLSNLENIKQKHSFTTVVLPKEPVKGYDE